ncbi:hypothetical protein HDV00_009461 [Rhizophlyctis rosea]|nr:hypothetical protein HDV00_009461 [Rhizophlyctis rosea]
MLRGTLWWGLTLYITLLASLNIPSSNAQKLTTSLRPVIGPATPSTQVQVGFDIKDPATGNLWFQINYAARAGCPDSQTAATFYRIKAISTFNTTSVTFVRDSAPVTRSAFVVPGSVAVTVVSVLGKDLPNDYGNSTSTVTTTTMTTSSAATTSAYTKPSMTRTTTSTHTHDPRIDVNITLHKRHGVEKRGTTSPLRNWSKGGAEYNLDTDLTGAGGAGHVSGSGSWKINWYMNFTANTVNNTQTYDVKTEIWELRTYGTFAVNITGASGRPFQSQANTPMTATGTLLSFAEGSWFSVTSAPMYYFYVSASSDSPGIYTIGTESRFGPSPWISLTSAADVTDDTGTPTTLQPSAVTNPTYHHRYHLVRPTSGNQCVTPGSWIEPAGAKVLTGNFNQTYWGQYPEEDPNGIRPWSQTCTSIPRFPVTTTTPPQTTTTTTASPTPTPQQCSSGSPTNTLLSINIRNNLNFNVDIIWIDYQCNPQPYGTLPHLQTSTQQKYENSVWYAQNTTQNFRSELLIKDNSSSQVWKYRDVQ